MTRPKPASLFRRPVNIAPQEMLVMMMTMMMEMMVCLAFCCVCGNCGVRHTTAAWKTPSPSSAH